MAFKSLRDESKANHGHSQKVPTIEQVNCGSLQRIADATEKMALNYNNLLNDKEQYKRWFEEESLENKRLTASINNYKGLATKLKKIISNLKTQVHAT